MDKCPIWNKLPFHSKVRKSHTVLEHSMNLGVTDIIKTLTENGQVSDFGQTSIPFKGKEKPHYKYL